MQFNVLHMFSVEGLRYFMPAYFIGALMFPKESTDWVPDWLSLLYPEFPPPWPQQVRSRALLDWARLVGILNHGQKHAVRLFLEHLLSTEPEKWVISEPPGNLVALMLANYWNQF